MIKTDKGFNKYPKKKREREREREREENAQQALKIERHGEEEEHAEA